MCGIIGYRGQKDAYKVIMEGLKTLEYRGYDSAGICVIKDNNFVRVRSVGKLSKLVEKTQNKDLTSSVGIGHTRWATHGVPNELNAHPHLVNSVGIVHNGIVENYLEIKESLKNKINLTSDTDSEIIAALINNHIKDGFLNAVFQTIKKLKGAYAVVAIHEGDPHTMLAFKKGPPLVLGIGKEDIIIASDVNPIAPYTKKVLYLEDEEVLEVKHNKFRLFDKNKNLKKPKPVTINWKTYKSSKDGFSHYMLKEIFDQPHSVKRAMLPFLDLNNRKIILPNLGFGKSFEEFVGAKTSKHDNTKQILKNCKKIFIVSCGTSYHASLIAKYAIEKWAGINVEVDIASEFRYRKPLIQSDTLFISISQSGETADSIAALRLSKKLGANSLTICNTIGSTLDRESEARIYMNAGTEVGVASTKAFTCSLATLYAFAYALGKLKNNNIEDEDKIFESFLKLPSQLDSVLAISNRIKDISKKIKKDRFLFMGRGKSFPIALEGALKLKELAYIQAEGYAAGELKHGPIALIDKDLSLVVIAPSDHVFLKTLSNLEEAKARGAKIILITDSNEKHLSKNCHHLIQTPKNSVFSSILNVVPLQLLAFSIACAVGNDVDRPRNLAKSVTVE